MDDEEGTRRSSRRVESSSKQKRHEALERMKEARKSGKMYKPDVEVEDVYKIVGDEEYNDIVRERQNDFVIDDDGAGYIDHGADVFDDEYEDEYTETIKESKKKKKKDGLKKGAINNYFTATATPKSKVDESQVRLEADDDLLKDALALVSDECLAADYEAPIIQNRIENSNPFRVEKQNNKRPATSSEDNFHPSPINKRIRLTNKHTTAIQRPSKMEIRTKTPTPEPKSPEKEQVESYADDFDPSIYDDDFTPITNETVKQNTEQMDAEEESINKENTTFKLEDWDQEDITEESPIVTAGAEDFYIKENDQQMIRMYWLDAYEDYIKHAGTIYLFGRVYTSKGSSASCAIIATNVERQIFFLPKDMAEDKEVYEEIKCVLQKEVGVSSFKCKKTDKKFMNDGTLAEGEHKNDVSVFEVRYDSKHPPLRKDLIGKTFEAVFNTTTTALERLLVEKEMMGPGWIDITGYAEAQAKKTYCDYEFTVDMEKMKNITYNTTEQKYPPFAKMLAINIITSLNGSSNEICMISALYNPKCNMSNPSIERRNLYRYCMITKTSSAATPFDLENQLKRLNLADFVKVLPNEVQLLNFFLAKMQKWEPDIIVGHDITSMIDLLKARLQKLNVVKWDRINRLKRSVGIGMIKNNKAGHWEITAGRLLLDSRLLAMELVRSRSYDLTELASLLLKTGRKEIYANEISSFYGRSERLIELINWSWEDPYISLRIVAHLNALPLALQITNIVGGVASRTLMGGRAERNEYLLLHAFYKNNIIAPNKYVPNYAKNDSKKVKKEEAGDEDGEEHHLEENAGKNKAQYAGGLVLEPKKGLYDTLILLLDFNSLYPSIIQEYNICFTTVKHKKDGNDLPDVPENEPDGVLPKEIKLLVERRRQVKSLMKDKNLSEQKRKQYDIRQMALKLTANSMYGCLGFQQSRFYAKPLAALITSKGREILMHSKDLVEQMGYTVVYGDTDSIMINTNNTDLTQAKKLGNEIKKNVNQCHKLLELDLDGVFKRMLLLKKKKYAALTVNPDDEKDMKKELKGLDIVRRDWSLLAKECGAEIVDLILNPNLTREELVCEIMDTLRKVRKSLDENKVDVKMFEISKQLTRNPKEYKDLKAQPHASVAARLNESGKFHLKHGDIVEYIICEDGTSNPATQRAYHHTELADNKDLKIDFHYYLTQQVHPVVSRLCAPIEETDAVVIAESLGIDSTSFKRSVAAAIANENAENELAWVGPETYDHCDSLQFVCPKCKNIKRVRSCIEGEGEKVYFALSKCTKCEYSLTRHAAMIENTLESALFDSVGKHHSSVFKCDEPICDYETASHPLGWSREGLECPKCSGGVLRKTYTTKDLFDQQNFYKISLDIDQALANVTPTERKILEHSTDIAQMKKLHARLLELVEDYLKRNAYNRVELSYLFGPMCRV